MMYLIMQRIRTFSNVYCCHDVNQKIYVVVSYIFRISSPLKPKTFSVVHDSMGHVHTAAVDTCRRDRSRTKSVLDILNQYISD